MSIITFQNSGQRETGQSLSVSAIAALMAIKHNYKMLLISTDFCDKTLEKSFLVNQDVSSNYDRNSLLQSNLSTDIANGFEGLARTFASNRASADMIKSYATPILKDRLDILKAPKTTDLKIYQDYSVYFSQIADYANKAYDIVMVDLNNKVPMENQVKLLNLSTLVLYGISQNQDSITHFLNLKNENDFYKRNNVVPIIGKYDPKSKYSAKNVARFLKEKKPPLTVPYSIMFSDYCSEGKSIDYILSMEGLAANATDYNAFFYHNLEKTEQDIDYKRQAVEFGMDK